MPVDPINYQASSRYEKSETPTMKLLLLFMFVAVAVAIEESDTQLATSYTRVLNITQEQALECIQKTGVTIEDMKRMEDSMPQTESEITDMKSVKRASCATVCCAQKQGTMVGKEIQLVEMFNYFEQYGAPKDVEETLKTSARLCKDEVSVADTEDECMVCYRFLKCMYVRGRTVFGEN
ncbi:uncharacterized protein LOC143365742 isoform X2 [Halictus rubicundus]|uniref:uncharacterized protein LOC143365742 isoform X2 n=1 Tax=Halictus rubicundus TaxID=77578 RepID=UPI00403674C5